MKLFFRWIPQGCFNYMSPKIAQVTGHDPERLLCKPFSVLVDSEQKEFIAPWLDKAKAGKKSSFSFRSLAKGEDPLWISATLAPGTDKGEKSEIFGLIKDITEHTIARREKELLENRLAQAQKMEAVGRLAGGIAHDFNNMLSPVLGYAEMLLHDFSDNEKARENLSEIIVAANRAKDLVRQILIFGSKAEEHPRPMELGSLLRDALRLVKASLPASTAMTILIEPLRFVVNADPTQLQRVLMNICSNASHAMQGREGLLEVILERDYLTQGKDSSGRSIQPGPYARLTIRDNGHGMPPEVLDKIFEPYYTTKDVGEGSGIGLAVAHSIVTKLGGSIQVTSKLGEWTCFCILLPLVKSEPAEEKTQSLSPLPMGKGHVLLVDDEPTLVHMTMQMLARLGYNVSIASDGLEALNILESGDQHFDLLITDLNMPGLTGDKLAVHVRDAYPGLPILLCTGYSESLTRENAATMGISAVLPKPVDMRRLALTAYRLTNPK